MWGVRSASCPSARGAWWRIAIRVAGIRGARPVGSWRTTTSTIGLTGARRTWIGWCHCVRTIMTSTIAGRSRSRVRPRGPTGWCSARAWARSSPATTPTPPGMRTSARGIPAGGSRTGPSRAGRPCTTGGSTWADHHDPQPRPRPRLRQGPRRTPGPRRGRGQQRRPNPHRPNPCRPASPTTSCSTSRPTTPRSIIRNASNRALRQHCALTRALTPARERPAARAARSPRSPCRPPRPRPTAPRRRSGPQRPCGPGRRWSRAPPGLRAPARHPSG